MDISNWILFISNINIDSKVKIKITLILFNLMNTKKQEFCCEYSEFLSYF